MNIKNVFLSIAIIIITFFVTFYGINTFLPKPNYEDFCNVGKAKICPTVCVPLYEINNKKCVFIECGSGCGPDGIDTFADLKSCEEGLKFSDEKRCELKNGTWIRQEMLCEKNRPCLQGYCDIFHKCNQDYNKAIEKRSRTVFFVALPLGILIIIIGAVLIGLEAVGVGLMGGGIITSIYGATTYWAYTENWIKFILSLIGLIILIFVTYYINKKFRNEKTNLKRKSTNTATKQLKN